MQGVYWAVNIGYLSLSEAQAPGSQSFLQSVASASPAGWALLLHSALFSLALPGPLPRRSGYYPGVISEGKRQ